MDNVSSFESRNL